MLNFPTLRDIIHARRIAVDAALAESHRAIVLKPNGDIRPVVNLGWLLRHRSDVLHPLQGMAFHVVAWRYGTPGHAGHSPIDGRPHLYARIEDHAPVLVALLNDGSVYACSFADVGVARDFLDRPSWSGYRVSWDTSPAGFDDYSIGSAEFRSFDPYARRKIGAAATAA